MSPVDPPEAVGIWQPPQPVPWPQGPQGNVFPWVSATTITDPATNATKTLSFQDQRGIHVIHSVVLHTGKLLWFSGHFELSYYATVSYLFDPENPAGIREIPFPPDVDFFCCHHVQLEDGKILVVGGSELTFAQHGSTGAKTIAYFDPELGNEHWENTKKELNEGRWYPTAVLLADGRVAVFSGRHEWRPPTGNPPPEPAFVAKTVEIVDPADQFTSRVLDFGQGPQQSLPTYPGLHLVPDGRIFFTHTTWGQEIDNPTTRALTIGGTRQQPTGSWNTFASTPPFPASPRREEGMSVLLPPAQDGKILVIGGSTALNVNNVAVTAPGGGSTGAFDHIHTEADPFQADVLDTAQSQPDWTPAGTTMHGRTNGHLVLLPDRKVLVLGGHDLYKWRREDATPPTTRSFQAEIFTPGQPGFFTAAMPAEADQQSRMYHSVAMLLRDGRVLLAGGAEPNAFEPVANWPADWPAALRYLPNSLALNQKTYQIYEPPYMHKGPRPTIDKVQWSPGIPTDLIGYGQTFQIETPQAASITHVALMRPGAPTHHTDTEQRYVALTNFTRNGNVLSVQMLPAGQANTAPPGYYWLWIVDGQGRPCQKAPAVRVTYPFGQPVVPPAKPAETSSCPCSIVESVVGPLGVLQVAYLRMVRGELAASESWVARAWMAGVSRLYGWGSPPVARWLRRHRHARKAVGEVVVRRLVRGVLVADRRSRRSRTLVTWLTLEAVAAVVLAPVAALAVAVRAVADGRSSRGD